MQDLGLLAANFPLQANLLKTIYESLDSSLLIGEDHPSLAQIFKVEAHAQNMKLMSEGPALHPGLGMLPSQGVKKYAYSGVSVPRTGSRRQQWQVVVEDSEGIQSKRLIKYQRAMDTRLNAYTAAVLSNMRELDT